MGCGVFILSYLLGADEAVDAQAALLLCDDSSSGDGLTTDEDKCRQAAEKELAKYAFKVGKCLAKCRKLEIKGKTLGSCTESECATDGMPRQECDPATAACVTKMTTKAYAKLVVKCPDQPECVPGLVTDYVASTANLVGEVDRGVFCYGCLEDKGLTVYNNCTGLEWEKKTTSGSGGLHDVDNQYAWAGICDTSGVWCQPNADAEALCRAQTLDSLEMTEGCARCTAGRRDCDTDPLGTGAITTVWDWLDQVRDAGFAGESDWRLATSAGIRGFLTGEPAELESILDLNQGACGGGSGACIDPLFGPTATDSYWSASTFAPSPDFAWGVYFSAGSVNGVFKYDGNFVRAVRSGS